MEPRKITVEDLTTVSQHLTENLRALETRILKPKSILSSSAKSDYSDYVSEMHALAKKMRMISGYYLKNISTNDLRLHNKIESSTQDYCRYVNASTNISALIRHDILTQLDSNHALLATERWAYLLKLAFESNDFSTAAAIVGALGQSSLSKLQLTERMSETAQAILKHTASICLRPKMLHSHQESRLLSAEEVVPSLSALTHLLLMIEEQPDIEDKHTYISNEKTRYSTLYENMQASLILPVETETQYTTLFEIIDKPKDESLVDLYTTQIDQLKKSKCDIKLDRIINKAAMYQPCDAYYLHVLDIDPILTWYQIKYAKSEDKRSAKVIAIMRDSKLSYVDKLNSLNIITESIETSTDIADKELLSDINPLKIKLGQIISAQAQMNITNEDISEKNLTKSQKTEKNKKHHWGYMFSPYPSESSAKHSRTQSEPEFKASQLDVDEKIEPPVKANSINLFVSAKTETDNDMKNSGKKKKHNDKKSDKKSTNGKNL